MLMTGKRKDELSAFRTWPVQVPWKWTRTTVDISQEAVVHTAPKVPSIHWETRSVLQWLNTGMPPQRDDRYISTDGMYSTVRGWSPAFLWARLNQLSSVQLAGVKSYPRLWIWDWSCIQSGKEHSNPALRMGGRLPWTLPFHALLLNYNWRNIWIPDRLFSFVFLFWEHSLLMKARVSSLEKKLRFDTLISIVYGPPGKITKKKKKRRQRISP